MNKSSEEVSAWAQWKIIKWWSHQLITSYLYYRLITREKLSVRLLWGILACWSVSENFTLDFSDLNDHLAPIVPPPLVQDPWRSPDPGLGTSGYEPSHPAGSMLLLSDKRAGYLQNKGGLLSRSQALCGLIHKRAAGKWAGLAASVLRGSSRRLLLLGARTLEVLADKGARRTGIETRRHAEGSVLIPNRDTCWANGPLHLPLSSQMHLLPQSLSRYWFLRGRIKRQRTSALNILTHRFLVGPSWIPLRL